MSSSTTRPPEAHGLYDPRFEHDACGIGFVAQVRGEASHRIVLDADEVLRNMEHRGASGAEPNTGDGAGMLTGLPDRFLRKVAERDLGVTLPERGSYGVGNVFLPTDEAEREHAKRTVERLLREQGLSLLGWRLLPIDADGADLGRTARLSMPEMEQLFVSGERLRGDDLERALYVVRKRASNGLRADARLRQRQQFYICSLSTRVLVYKGMLTSLQLLPFYPDLQDWDYRTHLAMVHSRFSTNTFPSWDRAQPLRTMSHNGEINTLRGNVGSMHDRERVVKSPLLGDDLMRCLPIIEPNVSDSGSFDNVLEFLLMGGRSLASSIMMMIPEAWQNDAQMDPARRAYYEYHSCMMEPWDGPASIVFTDGRFLGAVLDRNGLRPSRYYLTTDGRMILSSEVGVLPSVRPEQIAHKGRLKPGRMLLVDFEQGRMVPDEEVKATIAEKNPYARWLDEQRIELAELPAAKEIHGFQPKGLVPRLRAFGYTTESLELMLLPVVKQGRDPVGSMGNDAALACLSEQPRLVYDYFKQLFAQVTNPPIDSIREDVVMSLASYMGPEGNLLDVTERHAHRIRLPHPILTNAEVAALRELDHRGYRGAEIDITWPRLKGAAGIDVSLRRIARDAERAVDEGVSVLVLSDREAGPERVPISALLAVGAVHQHLVRAKKRTRVGLVVETGEAREVHHFCLLTGYGADAVNPYLAFDALWQARREGRLDAGRFPDDESVLAAYKKGVGKGMLKVLAKMGISTLQSYKGAQIFEAIGLGEVVVDHCFTSTPSRIGGVGFDVLADQIVRRHELGWPSRDPRPISVLTSDGQHHYRVAGEKHAYSPAAIRHLQRAARGDDEAYAAFAREVDESERTRTCLRGLLRFKHTTPIPLEDVEPASAIARRFVSGAMSFGSISEEAHTSMARAMNQLGGRSNTGEGGEDPARYRPLADGSPNPRRSAIKQVASGRFGVTIDYLASADEIQIKMAQGAKPGEGGELPGRKVGAQVAAIRHSTPGVGLISPPPHHDIYSIEDLKQLVYDLKNANPGAIVSVKLVAEVGVGTIAAGVAKAHADLILISGHDGGTGASARTSIKHAGMPWELGLAEAHQTLVMNDLRSRVVLQTDGQLKTGRDVVIAALLGAEEFGFATAPLIALGCVMMRKCHMDTCPVGIATQNPELRKRFRGEPEHVVRYLLQVAEHARRLMASLGFTSIDEMIGRSELLEMDPSIHLAKDRGLDLSALLEPARPGPGVETRCTRAQDHGLDMAFDRRLIELAEPALTSRDDVRASLRVTNTDRAVGTMLSYELAKRFGEQPLADDTIHFELSGTAGQSLGAWLAPGVTLELEGDANDYVGKGLSGGRIVLYPPPESTFVAQENVILGNVALYGAVRGEAFLCGRAAERFAVRNSGADVVVEGIGDHGCEYMTGGRVVILGRVGRNFGAGMSGGLAYLLRREGDEGELSRRLARDSLLIESVAEDAEDEAELRDLVARHAELTNSKVASALLADWPAARARFLRVTPREYLEALKRAEEAA
ncbi:MAG: glutamate synthase large subunit [Deltaproteobacteria bacterium]|nr:glutamate synthase large subunit [Deltaproteobacteria bacterium]